MLSIKKLLRSIIHKADNSSPANPYLHEMIERDAKFRYEYEEWLDTPEPKNLCAWINQQFRYFNDKPEWQSKQIVFLDKPTASGFLIYPDGQIWQEHTLMMFADYMKHCSMEAGYKLYMSDRRVYQKTGDKKDAMEEVQRHYMKPPIRFSNAMEKQNQLYGNISIDLILLDDEVNRLQLTAHGYSDAKYHAPKPFSEFIEGLL